MLRDGSLEIKDTSNKKPELAEAKEILTDLASNYSLNNRFGKPDYFVPISLIEGMAKAERLQRNGV